MGSVLSNPRWLAGTAAGLTAAILSLWAMRGLPLGFAAFWLTPLPLFASGLGFGPGAMAWAAAIAAVIHLAVAGLLPTVVFLVGFAVPALLMVVLGFRRGRLEIGTPLAVLGIWPAIVILLAGFAFSGVPGGLEGAIRMAVVHGLQRMGASSTQFPVSELVQVMAAAIGFWSAVSLSVNGAAAQSALARTGIALAPTPHWSAVRLPGWYPPLTAIGAAGWLAFGGEDNVVALSVLLVLLLPVFLQGIAAVHRRSAGRPGRHFMLGVFYAGLVILSVPAAIAVTAFGFYEQWAAHEPARRHNMIELILMQRVDKLGQMGELVKVRPGYARNFLLPSGKAIRANKENLARFERERAQLEAQNIKRREEAERVAERVAGLSVTIIRQAGESGALYGSVSTRDVAEACTAAGLTTGRDQVNLAHAIKSVGLATVQVALHPEVSIPVVVNVARSVEEAEKQARGERVEAEAEAEAASLEAELAAELAAGQAEGA